MHEKWMKKAIDLANENEQVNNGAPFGAIIVKEDKIIGTGVNEVGVTNDPTTHAEIQAVRQACLTLERPNLKGAVMYASTEPCPMCLSAVYYSQIKTVYFREPSNPSQDYVYKELSLPREERDITLMQLTP